MKVEFKQPEPPKPDVVITLSHEEYLILRNIAYTHAIPDYGPSRQFLGQLYEKFKSSER